MEFIQFSVEYPTGAFGSGFETVQVARNSTATLNVPFGYFPGQTNPNTYTSSDILGNFSVYIKGQYSPLGGVFIYSDIDSVDVSDFISVAPSLNTSLETFILNSQSSDSYTAYKFDFSGPLSNVNNPSNPQTIMYRQGTFQVETVNALDDVPFGADIFSFSRPSGRSTVDFYIRATIGNDTYTLHLPMFFQFGEVPEFYSSSVTRKGDKEISHSGYSIKSSSQGSPDVFVDGIPAHTATHTWPSHNLGDSWHTNRSTTTGSDSVYINGEPLARVSDSISCGSKIGEGSSTVFSG